MKTQATRNTAPFANFHCLLSALIGFALLILAAQARAVAPYSMYTTRNSIVGNSAYLRPDPDPTQVYIVTPNGNPGGFTALGDPHPIGVWYNSVSQNWAIFNEDRAFMQIGAGFNVWASQPTSNVYVHRAGGANTHGHFTFLSHSLLDGNPNALIWVTQNWNPGQTSGIYNSHHVGVFYDPVVRHWAVFNEDQAEMSVGAAFNIVIEATSGTSQRFVARATRLNLWPIYINAPDANNNPQAKIFVTPVYNPGGTASGVFNNHALIVRYDSNRQQWYLANQDGGLFTLEAAFNVWVER